MFKRSMRGSIIRGVSTCKSCGKKMLFQGYDTPTRATYLMERYHICFECAYWREMLEYPPENIEVVRGILLQINPFVQNPDKSMILGTRGRARYFIRNDGTMIESNDVWTIATIPKPYKNKFQDTAIEITRKAYKSLKQNRKKCRAKTCFNRYMCYRYDTSIEKKSGPLNAIPKNWNPKDEHCGSFIDKNEINIKYDITNKKLQS